MSVCCRIIQMYTINLYTWICINDMWKYRKYRYSTTEIKIYILVSISHCHTNEQYFNSVFDRELSKKHINDCDSESLPQQELMKPSTDLSSFSCFILSFNLNNLYELSSLSTHYEKVSRGQIGVLLLRSNATMFLECHKRIKRLSQDRKADIYHAKHI